MYTPAINYFFLPFESEKFVNMTKIDANEYITSIFLRICLRIFIWTMHHHKFIIRITQICFNSSHHTVFMRPNQKNLRKRSAGTSAIYFPEHLSPHGKKSLIKSSNLFAFTAFNKDEMYN